MLLVLTPRSGAECWDRFDSWERKQGFHKVALPPRDRKRDRWLELDSCVSFATVVAELARVQISQSQLNSCEFSYDITNLVRPLGLCVFVRCGQLLPSNQSDNRSRDAVQRIPMNSPAGTMG